MEQYQHEFIEFALAQKALLFGEFKLKSGRISPYFFNAGQFNTGGAMAKLGFFYATAFIKSGVECDILFGPAYKGIPLVASLAVALFEKYQIDMPFCFNRKEAKTYGEGGNIIGAPLKGRVAVIDDVVSAGTTFRETAQLVENYPANITVLITAMDRQERGTTSQSSAISEIEAKYAVKAVNIIKLEHLIEYLENQPKLDAELDRMRAYQTEYGFVKKKS